MLLALLAGFLLIFVRMENFVVLKNLNLLKLEISSFITPVMFDTVILIILVDCGVLEEEVRLFVKLNNNFCEGNYFFKRKFIDDENLNSKNRL